MSSSATLEVVCGHCGTWWMRWTADLDKPFPAEEVSPYTNGQVFAVQALGGYQKGTDGKWYRWVPGATSDLPPGEVRGRYVFRCPAGCRSNVQAVIDNLEVSANRVLKQLHADGVGEPFRTTVNKLLPSMK